MRSISYKKYLQNAYQVPLMPVFEFNNPRLVFLQTLHDCQLHKEVFSQALISYAFVLPDIRK
jgi:hypothetical protein